MINSKIDFSAPDPLNDYTCDICSGSGYSDTGECGMCEGGGLLCWKPIDNQWIAVPIKYKNTSLYELEKICIEKFKKIEDLLLKYTQKNSE